MRCLYHDAECPGVCWNPEQNCLLLAEATTEDREAFEKIRRLVQVLTPGARLPTTKKGDN